MSRSLFGNVRAWSDQARRTFSGRLQMRTDYDLQTAVSFLFAGLGLGALIALIFVPRESVDYILSDSPSFRRRSEARSRRAV
jgi:hypothetical protein